MFSNKIYTNEVTIFWFTIFYLNVIELEGETTLSSSETAWNETS